MGVVNEPLAPRRHRLTAEEYQRLGAARVLAPDARVELIEGEVIDMAPIGSRHWSVVNRLQRLFDRAVGELAIVSVQSSLRLGAYSEPLPDVGLFRPRDDFYAGALPGVADTLLVVEVSDTTARYDREVKLPLYARHGVPELWIVDLEAQALLTCRRPRGESYAEVLEARTPGVVAIAALPGATVDLSGLLG